MTLLLAAPFAATLLLVGLSRVTGGTVRPRRVAQALTLGVVAVAASTTGALSLLAWPLVARLGVIAQLGRWRPGAVVHRVAIPAVLSAVALVALLMILARVTRSILHLSSEIWRLAGLHRALARSGAPAVVVIDDPVPMAYAAPSLTAVRGRAMISAGLVDALDPAERDAVIAHERAHLTHHHHLFAVLLDLAVALSPALNPVVSRARFELERWADEGAVAATDTTTAASALAKTALARLESLREVTEVRALRLHVGRYRVTDRVEALLASPAPADRHATPVVLLLPAIVSLVAVVVAAHQMELAFEAIRRLQ